MPGHRPREYFRDLSSDFVPAQYWPRVPHAVRRWLALEGTATERALFETLVHLRYSDGQDPGHPGGWTGGAKRLTALVALWTGKSQLPQRIARAVARLSEAGVIAAARLPDKAGRRAGLMIRWAPGEVPQGVRGALARRLGEDWLAEANGYAEYDLRGQRNGYAQYPPGAPSPLLNVARADRPGKREATPPVGVLPNLRGLEHIPSKYKSKKTIETNNQSSDGTKNNGSAPADGSPDRFGRDAAEPPAASELAALADRIEAAPLLSGFSGLGRLAAETSPETIGYVLAHEWPPGPGAPVRSPGGVFVYRCRQRHSHGIPREQAAAREAEAGQDAAEPPAASELAALADRIERAAFLGGFDNLARLAAEVGISAIDYVLQREWPPPSKSRVESHRALFVAKCREWRRRGVPDLALEERKRRAHALQMQAFDCADRNDIAGYNRLTALSEAVRRGEDPDKTLH